MCPFCMATAVWIAVGAVSSGGISALAVTKLRKTKPKETERGGSNDEQ